MSNNIYIFLLKELNSSKCNLQFDLFLLDKLDAKQ